MYGKIFGSMFEGSMVGSGAVVFATMSYVIANMRPDRKNGAVVELNPKLLAFVLGESEKDVQAAIDLLCKPDKNSRSKEEHGRRLIQLGQFEYKVVNGAKYREIRNEEERRAQNAINQARFRFRQKNPGKPLPGELAYVKGIERGDTEEELARLSEPRNGKK